MSGHSKWNNIKNRKGAADAKRSAEFTMVSKQIRMAVKEGGSDNPDFNPKLRIALEKARAVNMPKQNVARAIERGMGKTGEGKVLQEVLYEGYGPSGVAIMALAITDNTVRSASEVRAVFTHHQGSLAGPHAAAFMFSRSVDGQGYEPTLKTPVAKGDLAVLTELLAQLTALEEVEEVYHTAELPEVNDE